MPFRHNASPDSSRVAFDPSRSCLQNLTNGNIIYLSPAEGKLLQILIDEKGSKQNIIYEIWEKNGTIVGESSYHQLVKMLRGKLSQAGLPKSVIKTIPRFGVVLMRDGLEHPSSGDTDASPLSLTVESGSLVDTPEPVNPSVGFSDTLCAAEHSSVSKPRLYTLGLQLAVLMAATLLPFSYLLGVTGSTDAFPYKIQSGNVTYHYANSYVTGSQRPEDIGQALSKNIHQVYVASNGPKVWIAKCTDKISGEDSECRFEHFSVY